MTLRGFAAQSAAGVAFLLSACGGGGGGTPTAPVTAVDPPSPTATVVLSPDEIERSIMQGDAAQFTFDAFYGNTSGTVYATLDAASTVFQAPQVTRNPDDSFTIALSTLSNLAAGTHEGDVALHLCMDPSCTVEYNGSPWTVPYRIVVQSTTNLTALSRWPDIDDWRMYQGNARHSGYMPVTLNPVEFSGRWIWRGPTDEQSANILPVSPPVIANGLVYISSSGYFSKSRLFALRESDKSVAWVHDFGTIFRANPPAVAGNRVFAATSGHDDTAMWGFDAATGDQVFKTPFDSQWEHYYAPTIVADAVYTNGGYYGGAYGFSAASGAQLWFRALNQYDEWTPAADANHLYAYVGESCSGCNNSGLRIIDRMTGEITSQVFDETFSWHGWSVLAAPILAGDGSVVMNNGAHTATGTLLRFDVQQGDIAWSVPGSFAGNPALARGVIYVGNNATDALEARRLGDGALLWSWPAPMTSSESFVGDVLVTDNLVFVSTSQAVHAIDLTSHQSVWSYPKGGTLALSANGILYIRPVASDTTTSTGTLIAINVK